jgi:hypothetical protein
MLVYRTVPLQASVNIGCGIARPVVCAWEAPAMVPAEHVQLAFARLCSWYEKPHVDLLIEAGSSTRLGCSFTALQSTTLSASEMQLSDHENDQHGAESEVERIELDFDGHGDGLRVRADCIDRVWVT